MSEHITTQAVQRAFSQASDSYDAHAVLQREIGDRLLAHMEFTRIEPRRILDIGCGTGYFTRLLRKKFRQADITAIDLSPGMVCRARAQQPRRLPWHGRHHHAVADAMALPFPAERFDLVCSNLVMQWVPDPAMMMQEMRRVLAPGGLMLFSTFGRRTLSELRQSLSAIDPAYAASVLPFADVMSLGDALMALPVELPVTDSDLFTLTYPDVMSLMRELKGLGASASAIRRPPQGLYGRSMIRRLEQHYHARYGTDDGRVRATFEALYAQAWYKQDPAFLNDMVIPIQAGRA